VTTSFAVGKAIRVRTFSGVEIVCIIKNVRHTNTGPIYDVVPGNDPKVKEFRAAGVPVDDNNARDPFVAFDWQILR
jgi:hypothetical protein